VVADDFHLGSALGRYAVNELKGKSIVTIDDRTAYGQGVAEEFAKAVKASGGKIEDSQYTTDKATDFTAILIAVKAKNPDVVFYGGMDAAAGPMIRQMKQLGINTKFVGGDGICSADLPKLAAGSVADGQVICAEAGGVQGTQRVEMDRFKEDFKKKFGTDVQLYAPYVYDAVNVMVAAMVKAGSTEPKVYLPVLATKANFNGVTGNISFDAKGDLKNGALTLFTYRGGARSEIGVASAAGEIASIPIFPWPPPAPSTDQVLARNLLTSPIVPTTLSDVDSRLRTALSRAGYASRSYYAVPGGFALATRLERFDEDGRPASEEMRWKVGGVPLPEFTLSTYLKALFGAQPGRFRVIVFVVSSTGFQAVGASPTRTTAESWLAGGFNVLPRELGNLRYTSEVNCTALVYEFSKPPGGSATLKAPSDLIAEKHLRGSGFLAALGG